jgi:trans-aconitate methyltransferase
MSPQTWDPTQYQTHAGFVPALGVAVLECLAPRAGERILDLGCGDGALTIRLLEAGCSVLGVDSSPELVAAARARGIDARVQSGEALNQVAEFEAVFSNAALHWMTDAPAVVRGVFRALKPGGRFVAEMGGAGNVAAICGALVAALDRRGLNGASYVPWYYPTPDAYRSLLEAEGFVVERMEHFARPTPLPGDILAWLQTMAQPFLAPLPAHEHAGYFAEVREALRPSLQRQDGSFWADYVRLRFVARRS